MPGSENKISDRIQLVQGDITRLEVDAIVNAANKSLLGGGGVDGAIHRAAGPSLLEECKTLNGCATGEAKVTSGYNLPAKFVIHAVGPVWNGGENEEGKFLANAYRNSLRIAKNMKINSVAFPNISTGIYGFPKEKAAGIALDTVKEWLKHNSLPEKVVLCIFDDENTRIYSGMMGK